jgi:hypothetical protein
MKHRRAAVGAAAAVALVLAAPATANAHGGGGRGEPVTTVAGGLDGPRQLSQYNGGKLLVAESDSGEVSSVDPRSGQVSTIASGLGNAQGVDAENGRIYVAVGEAGGPPPEEGAAPVAPPPGTPSQVLLELGQNGKVVRSFDLLDYEIKNNPDKQLQFNPETNEPVDTLSNPFSVLAQRDRVLVSDAGANAVLSVDRRSGQISTFFVPPVVTDTPECAGAENNPGTVGCDPVPTEITEGSFGLIYVGTLSAEAPGAARVYVLDSRGRILHVIKGLTSVTGVAVDHFGTVYASNVLAGAPEGPPPAGFDPSTVGEITRISFWGQRSTAKVTMPTGLEVDRGGLYASAWSIASFVGLPPGTGEVQRVGDRAFSGGR